MLAAVELGKRVGARWILRGVSLRLEPGERVWVVGPNGAGKTTLLRLLAGVARPSAGMVTVAGETLEPGRADLRRLIGYVAHEPLLVPELTVGENLAVLAGLYGSGTARAAALLDEFGLRARADEPVRALSRGLRQRVALIRALLHEPPILILDEPSTALDREGRDRLAALLEQHARSGGMAVIATHEPVSPGERVLALSGGATA